MDNAKANSLAAGSHRTTANHSACHLGQDEINDDSTVAEGQKTRMTRKHYSCEFKLRAIALAVKVGSSRKASKMLQISEHHVGKWRQSYDTILRSAPGSKKLRHSKGTYDEAEKQLYNIILEKQHAGGQPVSAKFIRETMLELVAATEASRSGGLAEKKPFKATEGWMRHFLCRWNMTYTYGNMSRRLRARLGKRASGEPEVSSGYVISTNAVDRVAAVKKLCKEGDVLGEEVDALQKQAAIFAVEEETKVKDPYSVDFAGIKTSISPGKALAINSAKLKKAPKVGVAQSVGVCRSSEDTLKCKEPANCPEFNGSHDFAANISHGAVVTVLSDIPNTLPDDDNNLYFMPKKRRLRHDSDDDGDDVAVDYAINGDDSFLTAKHPVDIVKSEIALMLSEDVLERQRAAGYAEYSKLTSVERIQKLVDFHDGLSCANDAVGEGEANMKATLKHFCYFNGWPWENTTRLLKKAVTEQDSDNEAAEICRDRWAICSAADIRALYRKRLEQTHGDSEKVTALTIAKELGCVPSIVKRALRADNEIEAIFNRNQINEDLTTEAMRSFVVQKFVEARGGYLERRKTCIDYFRKTPGYGYVFVAKAIDRFVRTGSVRSLNRNRFWHQHERDFAFGRNPITLATVESDFIARLDTAQQELHMLLLKNKYTNHNGQALDGSLPPLKKQETFSAHAMSELSRKNEQLQKEIQTLQAALAQREQQLHQVLLSNEQQRHNGSTANVRSDYVMVR